MPTLSRWFIKTGLIYLMIALLVGAVLLMQPVMGWSSQWQALRPVYLHLIFIGWVTQVIMGVGYWMFPKYSPKHPRGDLRLGWAVFILLNLGLILRSIAEPAAILAPQAGLGGLLGIAAVCLVFAGWGFAVNTWGRIKER
ncbi:MAG: cbb3-type cytochrome c oxidase subunit I [Anaerolineae bacterium]|jgi:hypothetical protein|nr:cbb3-type cytochrome c oxidase subunit I [Anaerolineae bacterium]